VDARRTTGSNQVVDRLFVYATLRQGQTARSLIANHIVRHAAASTPGTLYVFPMGYAGFVEGPGPNLVIGEVLWLSELAAAFGLLDAYEGQDFTRVLVKAQIDHGEPVWSWIYALSDPEAVRHGTAIEHGDWARYLTEHE
jgi:gamma-glutamylcyclotransferase (GGCT)/AIG2-like uncharacterized protein YtfP